MEANMLTSLDNSFYELEGVFHFMVPILLSFLFCCILYFSWLTSCRRALEYDIFLVEMHTMQQRRLVEILYTGCNHNTDLNCIQLMDRLRLRARHGSVGDGELLSISDTSIVIQAPSNYSNASSQSNTISSLYGRHILWDVELPCDSIIEPNPARDSQIAAIAAITVLSRPRLPASSTSSLIERDDNTLPSTVIRVRNMSTSHRGTLLLRQHRLPIALSLTRVGERNQTSVNATALESQSILHSSTNQGSSNIHSEEDQDIAYPSTSTNVEPCRIVRIRLKFLDDTQKIVDTNSTITVLQFKRKYFMSSLEDGKIVRLIFRGTLLRDDSRSLESYGVHDGCILHCHVSNVPYSTVLPVQAQEATIQRTSDINASNNRQSFSEHHYIHHFTIRFCRTIWSSIKEQFTTFFIFLHVCIGRFLLRNHRWFEPSLENNFISTLYRRVHWYFTTPLSDNSFADITNTLCIGNFLLWIFGAQCALVWMFVCQFPQLCDRTAFGVLLLLSLYFVFVVIPLPYRRQEAR